MVAVQMSLELDSASAALLAQVDDLDRAEPAGYLPRLGDATRSLAATGLDRRDERDEE